MIGDALRVELEMYAATLEQENPLYVAAKRGAFTPEVASRYLVNVRHLIRHTSPHLERARARAFALGDRALAEHFGHKLAEEHDHDRWADEDLQRLGARFGTSGCADVVPALADLLRFLEATIDRDPFLYLAYMLFAEYVVAARGGEWLQVVQEVCGIPVGAMSVIAKHAELDRAHTDEGFETIDALVREPSMLGPMRATLLASREFFHRFCEELVSDTRTRDARCAASAIA